MDHEFHHHLSISLWNNEHGGNFTYDGADRVTHISSNGSSSSMRYDAHGALYYQQDVLQESNQSVTYTKHMVGGFEKKTRSGGAGSLTEYRYTVADDVVIVQRQSGSNHSEATYFLFKDHLGSVFTTLASTGEIISQQLFSAFGQTRTIYTASGVALGSMLPPTEQGFTGHRQMDALGIVHMKGRIYDPTLGRFLQADPFVQEPKNSQNYNRYSYVLNNPMSYTDPSGYFFSKLWEKIKPIIGVIVVAVLYANCQACATYFSSSWYGAATAGAIAGGVNAGFNGGNILTGALRGAFAAAAFYGVGEAFSGMDVSMGTSGYYSKVLMHGITGGVMNVLSGGKFGHGFAAAGVTQAFAPAIDKIDKGSRFSAGRVAAAALVGGTASSLSGGKFANGAVTGAFSRLFNDEVEHQAKDQRLKVNPIIKNKIQIDEKSAALELTLSIDSTVTEKEAQIYIKQIKEMWSVSDDGYTFNVDIKLVKADSDLYMTYCTPLKCKGIEGLGSAEIGGNKIWYATIGNYSTAAHEFGHILGFGHASPGTGSIMTYDKFRSVSSHEIRRVIEAYGD